LAGSNPYQPIPVGRKSSEPTTVRKSQGLERMRGVLAWFIGPYAADPAVVRLDPKAIVDKRDFVRIARRKQTLGHRRPWHHEHRPPRDHEFSRQRTRLRWRDLQGFQARVRRRLVTIPIDASVPELPRRIRKSL